MLLVSGCDRCYPVNQYHTHDLLHHSTCYQVKHDSDKSKERAGAGPGSMRASHAFLKEDHIRESQAPVCWECAPPGKEEMCPPKGGAALRWRLRERMSRPSGL